MLGTNTTVYLLTGPKGVGKSLLCKLLGKRVHLLSWETTTTLAARADAIRTATLQPLPIVLDCPSGVSTTMSQFSELSYRLYVMLPDLQTRLAQLEAHGAGQHAKRLAERQQRWLLRLAEHYDGFAGSYTEVSTRLQADIASTLPGIRPHTEQTFYVYCVYEVCSDGSKVPRYIGKGYDNADTGYSRLDHRVNPRKQDKKMHALVAEIQARGHTHDVQLLHASMTELEVLLMEAKEIRLHRDAGHPLINSKVTFGGGMVMTDDAKRRIADGTKRAMQDPQLRAYMSSVLKEFFADPELRKRISSRITARNLYDERHRATWRSKVIGSKRLPASQERKDKIAEAHRGVHLSIEHKEACSRGHLGLRQTTEAKQKLSVYWAGKKKPESQRLAMSAASKEWWARKKAEDPNFKTYAGGKQLCPPGSKLKHFQSLDAAKAWLAPMVESGIAVEFIRAKLEAETNKPTALSLVYRLIKQCGLKSPRVKQFAALGGLTTEERKRWHARHHWLKQKLELAKQLTDPAAQLAAQAELDAHLAQLNPAS